MSINFIRVDNRLIHGQVVQGWLPTLKIDEVVVVSDNAANSGLMSKMMRMALPTAYGLKVLGPVSAADYLRLAQANVQRIFVVLEEFSYINTLIDNGVKLSSVNIGNTKFEEDKKEYRQGVYLTEAEAQSAKALAQNDIKFDVRAVPSALSVRLF